jgi:hypothetical protein
MFQALAQQSAKPLLMHRALLWVFCRSTLRAG